jgi:hypothetical protein
VNKAICLLVLLAALPLRVQDASPVSAPAICVINHTDGETIRYPIALQ